MKSEEMTLDTEQQVDVKAAIGDVFKGVLRRLGEGNTRPNGQSLQMVLEQWPGGRWFRDLGNGTGHLWGHVQVVKAPVLLELSGPMFMSYPVASHVQYRLTEQNQKTLLSLTHRAFGLIAAKKIRPTDYITGEAPLSRLQQVLRHMLNRGGDIKTAIISGH